MDLVSIGLILLVAWIATVVVAVALARAAGRADEQADAAQRKLAVTSEPSDERTPLDALADEVMRTNARAGAPEPDDETPAAEQLRPAPKRFKRRSRFATRRDRIKHLRD